MERKERRNPLNLRNTNLIFAIVGSTASGKSSLGVQLAKKFNGEIVSADSRQVYKGLDIGSGKITKREMRGIPHHLLDVASPKKRFTVAQYRKLALKAIETIQKRGKLPILVGGSPFYIYSVVDGITIPEVKPDYKLRKKLEKLSVEQLFAKLRKLDSRRAATIEQKNKRRLVRALEIIFKTGKPVPPLPRLRPFDFAQGLGGQAYPVLLIGIKKAKPKIQKLIAQRLAKRFKQGMVGEVKRLHRTGLSWKRLEELGLEYRFIAQYLQGELSLQEMKQKLQKAIEDFSRCQMVWFKKDKRIHWIQTLKEAKNLLTS